jgi:hypothetical protein
MEIVFVVLIVMLLLGIIPLRRRFGSVSLVNLMVVVFLLGLLLGWF